MAVNNFAPAEYGGYVLGANSGGGGGGGMSPFDEMCGFTDFVVLTIHITGRPEGMGDIVKSAYTIEFGTAGEHYLTPAGSFSLYLDGEVTEIAIPIVDGMTTVISNNITYDGSNGGLYIPDGTIALDGDIEAIYDSYYKITGDCSMSFSLTTG